MILSWLFFKNIQEQIEQMSQIHFSKKWEIVQGSLSDTNPNRKSLKITTQLYQVWFAPKMGSHLMTKRKFDSFTYKREIAAVWFSCRNKSKEVFCKKCKAAWKSNTPTKKNTKIGKRNIGKHLNIIKKLRNPYIFFILSNLPCILKYLPLFSGRRNLSTNFHRFWATIDCRQSLSAPNLFNQKTSWTGVWDVWAESIG